ncbi:microsomal glutathione S-transferase 1 [Cydia splendana]|uniref:microsomal glutathione S-transferase 1 n=1 Tax=Cydia splendana TaxID=1100963 RepID=UPI0021247968
MVLSLEDPAVRSYIVYSSVLALKMLGVATLTSLTRGRRKAFANPEDAKAFKGKIKMDDPEVERVRRAHLNDLENIPAFWILGALYLTTGPAGEWATLLFRLAAAGRVLHTLVYAVVPLPQPTRALAYLVPYGINVYMGVQVVLHHANAL